MYDYEVGFTRTYINDYPDWRLSSVIPELAAAVWLKERCPEHKYVQAWLNKGFVVVEEEFSYFTALYNHDGKFYVYTLKV